MDQHYADLFTGYGFEDVLRIQRAEGDELVRRYDNVVGTGVGVKIVDGQFTGERALLLFVREKVQPSGPVKLSLDQLVPTTIAGIPVDVIEVGDVVKHSGFTRRARPVSPGFSISHGNVTAGTLGGIFLDADGEVVALSNNHVISCENTAKVGDPIYQPGIADMPAGLDLKFRGFPTPVQNLPYFATVKRFVKLQPGGAQNIQDSAIARVAPEIVADRMLDNVYPNGRPLSGFGRAEPGMQVQKFGRTTGLTQGTVLGLHAQFTIGYDLGPVSFADAIVCTPLSRGGDSGAMLVDREMRALGLLFAGSEKVSLFHPIHIVAQEYGLQVWTPPQEKIDPQAGSLTFWARTWRSVYPRGALALNNKGVLLCEAPAHQHAFAETPIQQPREISVDVFTGSDKGTSWGPGLAVTFPNGVIKLNVRYGQGFGAAWNGQEFLGRLLSSEPNRWYTLRLRLGRDWVVAEVSDRTARNDKWFKVVELPANKLQGEALSLRIGKFDVMGGGGDCQDDPGEVGRCQFSNLAVI